MFNLKKGLSVALLIGLTLFMSNLFSMNLNSKIEKAAVSFANEGLQSIVKSLNGQKKSRVTNGLKDQDFRSDIESEIVDTFCDILSGKNSVGFEQLNDNAKRLRVDLAKKVAELALDKFVVAFASRFTLNYVDQVEQDFAINSLEKLKIINNLEKVTLKHLNKIAYGLMLKGFFSKCLAAGRYLIWDVGVGIALPVYLAYIGGKLYSSAPEIYDTIYQGCLERETQALNRFPAFLDKIPGVSKLVGSYLKNNNMEVRKKCLELANEVNKSVVDHGKRFLATSGALIAGKWGGSTILNGIWNRLKGRR